MQRTTRALAVAVVGLVLALAPSSAAETPIALRGAGATFPYPLYARMFDEYQRERQTTVVYQAIGSGAGVQQLAEGRIDFAGTDAFVTQAPGTDNPLVHVPICLGAVVVTYNLPGNPALRLDQGALAAIFLGQISRWDDARMAVLNPGVTLPAQMITVVRRSDASGTTSIFTGYLATINAEWKARVGVGTTVEWPTGVGAKGNPGVAALVQQQTGSIGYCELAYALGSRLTFASLRNRRGQFVLPSLESTSRAAQIDLPPDTNASLVDTNVSGGYPVTGFTWIALRTRQDYDGRDRSVGAELVRLLWWMTHEGQRLCASLSYAPLPRQAVRRAEELLATITFGGARLLSGR